MSAYTIANLKELDDSAAGRDLDVEARFGRSHLDSDHLGVTYVRYGPGVRSPMGHSHREQEEIYVVLERLGPDQARRRHRRPSPLGRRPRRAGHCARDRRRRGRNRVARDRR